MTIPRSGKKGPLSPERRERIERQIRLAHALGGTEPEKKPEEPKEKLMLVCPYCRREL